MVGNVAPARPADVSIRLRLAVVFTAATALAGALFGYLFVTELASGLRSSAVAALETRASTLVQQLPETGSLPTGPQVQQGTVGGLSEHLAESQDLTQLLGKDGRVVDAAGPASGRRLVSQSDLLRARRAPVVLDKRLGSSRQHFLVVVMAATGQGRAFVVVGQSLTTADQAISRVVTAVTLVGALAVLGAGLAAWFLASRALRPVERMRRQAQAAFERGDPATLGVPGSHDEIARLAETLNALLAQLHAALERERGFTAAAGHELRSPLALIRAELELAGRSGRSAEYLHAAVERATGDVDRVIDLANQLLLLAQSDAEVMQLHPVETDLQVLVCDVLDGLRPVLAGAGVSVAVQADGPVPASADPAAYRRIVENLVENAVHHGGRLQRIDVVLRRVGEWVDLDVADDGTGFPPDFLPRAFERFSRADESRSSVSGGAGLGLSIVRALARAHGGDAAAMNGGLGGAIVTVRIRRKPQSTATAVRPPVSASGIQSEGEIGGDRPDRH